MLRTKDLQISKLYYLFIYMQLTPSHILFCIFPKHTHPYQCIFLSKFLRGQDLLCTSKCVLHICCTYMCLLCTRYCASQGCLHHQIQNFLHGPCTSNLCRFFKDFFFLIGQFALKAKQKQTTKKKTFMTYTILSHHKAYTGLYQTILHSHSHQLASLRSVRIKIINNCAIGWIYLVLS